MQAYKCSCNLVVLLCESQIDQNIGRCDLVVELAVHSATQPTLTYGAEETPDNFSVSNTTTSARASDSEASAIALVSNVVSDIASSMEENRLNQSIYLFLQRQLVAKRGHLIPLGANSTRGLSIPCQKMPYFVFLAASFLPTPITSL